jgi:hypothetical protein
MAGCDVLYFNPAQVGQVRRDPAGQPLGHPETAGGPVRPPGQVWTDPELVLRFVCTTHRRQLVALGRLGWPTASAWARGCQPQSGAAGAREPAGRDLARLPGPSGPLPGADRLANAQPAA